MDRLLRSSERASRGAPGDGASALVRSRRLARAGMWAEARAELCARVRARVFDNDLLEALRSACVREGLLRPRGSDRPLKAHADLVLPRSGRGGGGTSELVPTVAFVGARAADAWRCVSDLQRDLSAPVRRFRVLGEPNLELQLDLGSGWRITPGHVVRTVRVVTLPSGRANSKFRRQILRGVSGIVFLEAGSVEWQVEACALLEQELRRVQGCGLREVPLLVFRGDAAREDDGLTAVFGDEGAPATLVGSPSLALAISLCQVARGVQGVLRPR